MTRLPYTVIYTQGNRQPTIVAPRLFTLLRSAATVSISAVMCLLLSAGTMGQQPVPENKAEEILKRAIEVSGGSSYLNVRSITARGFFTPFQDGLSTIPSRFVDYIVYPDRERTEFTSAGIRVIQVNAGESGWVFDGAVKTITDMKPEQIDDFKRSLRTSVENILRGWWRKEGATLKYIGRREAGLAKRNETVRLTYPDGSWVEYEFGAKDGVPAKVIYKRNHKNNDTGEEEEVTEEDHFAKQIPFDGVTAPWVVDHFANKTQPSRINYEAIEYNHPIPDALFAKPDNVKSIK